MHFPPNGPRPGIPLLVLLPLLLLRFPSHSPKETGSTFLPCNHDEVHEGRPTLAMDGRTVDNGMDAGQSAPRTDGRGTN